MSSAENLVPLSQARSAHCKMTDCDWETGMTPSMLIATCFAVWHVYEEHYGEWVELYGERPPIDPDPRNPMILYMLMRVN